MLVAGFWSLLSFSKVNNVFPCFSITCRSKGCFLISHLTLNLSLNGMMTVVGKLISFPFKVTVFFPIFFLYIPNPIFLHFICTGVSLSLILNKCMLSAIFHRSISKYDCVSNMNNITLFILEKRCPLNKLDFLTLLVTLHLTSTIYILESVWVCCFNSSDTL